MGLKKLIGWKRATALMAVVVMAAAVMPGCSDIKDVQQQEGKDGESLESVSGKGKITLPLQEMMEFTSFSGMNQTYLFSPGASTTNWSYAQLLAQQNLDG